MAQPSVWAVRPTRADDREVLLRLARAAGSTRDLHRVLQAVTDAGTHLAGAEFGAFFYNDVDEHGRAYRFNVLSGAEADRFRAMASPRITPLFEPTFSGASTVRVDDVTHDPRFGGFPPHHLPVRSYLSVPVVSAAGEVYGALLFGHRDVGRFDARIEDAVRSVAGLAAVAVSNARLGEAEQANRLRAEEALDQLELLHGLTVGLSAALTESDVLDVLLQDVVRPLGAAAVRVFAGHPHDWRLVGWRSLRGADPALRPSADELPPPIARAMVTAAPVARPTSVAKADFPQLVRGGACPVRATLCLPLVTPDGVFGAMAVLWSVPREFGDAELTMLRSAAGQIAATLDRVRLFEAERAAREQLAANIAAVTAVAQTLQRSLLPRELPAVEEVAFAVRYRPGAADVEVGGDWYDVVATARGATLVIGDVQGHSLTAAAVMGQLRTGLHAYLAEGHDIDVAVARANTLLGELDPRVMATCCVVDLDVATGVLRVVRAGHPRPLLQHADGTVEEVDARTGVPLGVLSRTTWPVTVSPLREGDRLVLFTDGLVERRDEDIDAGVARLVAAVGAAAGGDPDTAADAVLDVVGHDLDDDVALLVCDVVGARTAGATVSLALRPGPDSIGVARAFTRTTLRAWDADVVDDAVLLVSEMVTNAIRYTEGRATLTLRREPRGVRIGVTDSESRPPHPTLHADPRATGGRGMHLIDVLAGAWGVEPTGSGKTVWAELATD